MERIKVVYIIHTFDIGGIEKVVLDLCNGLNKDIFDVSLIVLSNDRLYSKQFLNKGATCKFNQAAKPISSKLNFLTF